MSRAHPYRARLLVTMPLAALAAAGASLASAWTSANIVPADLRCHSIQVYTSAMAPDFASIDPDKPGLKTVEPGKAYLIRCWYWVFPSKLPPSPGLDLGGGWTSALLADSQTVELGEGQQKWDLYEKGAGQAWLGLHMAKAWIPSHGGEQEVRCWLDIHNTIKETNEANNECTLKVNVKPVSMSGPPATVGQPVVPPMHKVVKRDASANTAQAVPGGAERVPRQSDRQAQPGRGTDAVQVAPDAQPVRGQPASQVFPSPSWQGKRVDWCLHVGSECGELAASEFCKRSGYAKATVWTIATGAGKEGPTLVLGDDELCTGPSCNGFASITCSK